MAEKRELGVRPVGVGMFEVHWIGGGELPPALKGRFNNAGAATTAIENWKAAKENAKPAPKVSRQGKKILKYSKLTNKQWKERVGNA